MSMSIKLPKITENVSELEYKELIEHLLRNVDYSKFVAAKEQKEMFPISSSVESKYKKGHLEKLFIDKIQQQTQYSIISVDGTINDGFKAQRLFENLDDYHIHDGFIQSRINNIGQKYLFTKLVDNECKVLQSSKNDPNILVFGNNAYLSISFEYYPPTYTLKRGSLKNWFKPTNTYVPAIIKNYKGTSTIDIDMKNYMADLGHFNPIESFFGEFFEKLKPISLLNPQIKDLPNRTEFNLIIKQLRENSNHKNTTQSSSQHSDLP
jgi:hypothetical protein